MARNFPSQYSHRFSGHCAHAEWVRHEWAGAAGERFYTGGAVTYGIMLVSVINGVLILPDSAGCAWIAVGIMSGFMFYWREKRTVSLLIDLRVFIGNRTFYLQFRHPASFL